MNVSKSKYLKGRIIVTVMEFQDSGDAKLKKEALELITQYSKFYSIPLNRKVVTNDLKAYLKAFILNRDGYNNTIPNLYHCLINTHDKKQEVN